MNGVSDDRFDPYSTLTRGMVVTILHRLEGTPDISFRGVFDDVEPGIWYSEAVEWAAAEKIVNGYGDGLFGPNDPVTSEQLAAILYRYADYKGYRTDAADPAPGRYSAWAEECVRWAVVNEIIPIDGTYMRPAKRFEVAGAISAFCRLYAGS